MHGRTLEQKIPLVFAVKMDGLGLWKDAAALFVLFFQDVGISAGNQRDICCRAQPKEHLVIGDLLFIHMMTDLQKASVPVLFEEVNESLLYVIVGFA